jgi:hypothetical protein
MVGCLDEGMVGCLDEGMVGCLDGGMVGFPYRAMELGILGTVDYLEDTLMELGILDTADYLEDTATMFGSLDRMAADSVVVQHSGLVVAFVLARAVDQEAVGVGLACRRKAPYWRHDASL